MTAGKADLCGVIAQMVRALGNLIKNACESMTSSATANPELIIDLRDDGGNYVVTVADNGPGIAE